MKKVFLSLAVIAALTVVSCNDYYCNNYIIVKSVRTTTEGEFKYYVTFEPGFGVLGLYTNTNYKVGDTLK